MFDDLDEETFKKIKMLVVAGVLVIAFLVGMLFTIDFYGVKRSNKPEQRRPMQDRSPEPGRERD